MTPEAGCDKVLLVQAELDGELDAAAAAALASHRDTCPICRSAAEEIIRARAMIDAPTLREAMPAEVRARVLARIAAATPQPNAAAGAPRPRRWAANWRLAFGSFGLGAACAAAIALLLVAPAERSLTDQIVASHIRALQPGHLEDVASTDKHTVKPWFDGRIDFAPPVKDLAAEQFPLKGGRLDYIGGRPVAALVYQRRKHLIDLYIWPTAQAAAPHATQRQGYNVVHWTANGMTLWAVSDLDARELGQFAEDWRRSP